jgi:uncharacterized protein YgiM (DUF1202 family)
MTVSASTECVVTKNAPLREQPRKSSGIIRTLRKGATVIANFNSVSGKYVRVGYDGEWGWFYKSYLSTKSSGDNRVTVEECTLRTGPGYNYKMIMNIMRGKTVEVREIVDSWYKVVYNGRTGYIPGEALDGSRINPVTTLTTKNAKGLNTRMHRTPYLGTDNVIGSIPPNRTVSVLCFRTQRQANGATVEFALVKYNGKQGYVATSELE